MKYTTGLLFYKFMFFNNLNNGRVLKSTFYPFLWFDEIPASALREKSVIKIREAAWIISKQPRFY